MLIALIVGCIIIAALAFYAGKLLYMVKRQQQQVAKALAEQAKQQQQAIAERRSRIVESIVLIARAMDAEQCEPSEGCLRLWHLLGTLPIEPMVQVADEYPGIDAMYQVVKEMPTHEARKKYSKKEIFQQDKTRWQAEHDLADNIKQDVTALLARFDSPSIPPVLH